LSEELKGSSLFFVASFNPDVELLFAIQFFETEEFDDT
jgi:hypothetical protein